MIQGEDVQSQVYFAVVKVQLEQEYMKELVQSQHVGNLDYQQYTKLKPEIGKFQKDNISYHQQSLLELAILINNNIILQLFLLNQVQNRMALQLFTLTTKDYFNNSNKFMVQIKLFESILCVLNPNCFAQIMILIIQSISNLIKM